MNEKTTVNFDFEGATPGEVERFRLMVMMMFENGVFGIKNGSATLHFGPAGELGAIEVQMMKWRLRSNQQQPARQPEMKKA